MTHAPGMLIVALPFLMGMAVSACGLYAWLWAQRHGDSLAPWVAAWCAATLVILIGHYVQITAFEPGQAVLGSRIGWSGAVLLPPITMGMAHGLIGRPIPRRRLLAALAATAVLLALTLGTDLIMTRETSLRGSFLHEPYFRIRPGPLMLALMAALATAFAYVWATALSRSAGLPVPERRVVRVGMSVYAALAVNDLLNNARLIETERLFDVAFVALAAALTYVLVRRHGRLQTHLEEEVQARTREVEARAVWLDALVRSGQTLMAGLDLETTLLRISAEAQRIAGSPRVKVLLVDRDGGVLRPAAGRGRDEPAIPLGCGYSGTVASSGAPLFVADAQDGLPASGSPAAPERLSYLGLPIKKSGEVLGVLAIETLGRREYTTEELAYLGSFAGQAAIAIDNARLFGSATSREKRLATLITLTQSLTATLSLDEVLDRVVAHAVELFGSSVSRIWLVEDGGQTIALRAHAGCRTDVRGVTRMKVGHGIVGQVVATRAPIVVEDLAQHEPRLNAERHRAEQLASLCAVPLVQGDRAIGTLGVAVRERHAFTTEEVRVLQALADHAAIAVDNARLYAEAREQAHELEALHEVRQALVSSLDARAVLGAVSQWAVTLLGAQAAAVYELDPRDERLHLRTIHPADRRRPSPLRPGQGIAGAAFSERQPVSSADVFSEPPPGFDQEAGTSGRSLRDAAREELFHGILGAPMISRDRAFGTLCVYWSLPHRPDAREIRLVQALAQQAAVALENARLYQTLEERLRRLETLTRLNRLISSSLDTGTVLREITRAAAELMNIPAASFWTADEAAGTLTLIGFSDLALESDFPYRSTTFGDHALGWVAQHRRPVHIPDVFTPGSGIEAIDWWRRHGLRSFYAVPILHEGALLAVLALDGREPFRIDPGAEQQMAAFTAQVALAMKNAAAYEAEARARREAELALAQVEELQGLLPICAWCKKVRNDRNYWESIETYLSQRSRATFSHGICPDCRRDFMTPDVARRRRDNPPAA
jgi:GAF domain-containing protein